jgi:hypothetical protein
VNVFTKSIYALGLLVGLGLLCASPAGAWTNQHDEDDHVRMT